MGHVIDVNVDVFSLCHQCICDHPSALSIACFCRYRLMPGMEDLLFYAITEGKDTIPLSQFVTVSQQYLHTSPAPPELLLSTAHVGSDMHYCYFIA